MKNELETKFKLVDRYNIDEEKQSIIAEMGKHQLIGFDTETNGLTNPKLVGFSISAGEYTWYFDVAHRGGRGISLDQAREIIEAKPENRCWVIHNASFDVFVIDLNLGIRLKNYHDTYLLSLCLFELDYISPVKLSKDFDEYAFYRVFTGLKALAKVLKDDPRKDELLNQHISKMVSDGAEDEVTGKKRPPGAVWKFLERFKQKHGLKVVVYENFGYKMATLKETLGTADNLGELTAREVTNYGCDDAFWAVELLKRFVSLAQCYDEKRKSNVLKYYQEVELPMIDFYVDIRLHGVPIDMNFCVDENEDMLEVVACKSKDLKKALLKLIPAEYDPETSKVFQHYLKELGEEAEKVVSKTKGTKKDVLKKTFLATVEEIRSYALGKTPKSPFGSARKKQIIVFDFMDFDLMYNAKERLSVDKNTLGTLSSKVEDQASKALLDCLKSLANIESVRKASYDSYLNFEKEFGKGTVNPDVKPLTKTKRLAATNPNIMNPPKRGEGSRFRKVFIPDKDCLMVTADWSAIELVILAEKSKDPEMVKVFGSLPHGDLHGVAGLAIAKALHPSITLEQLKKEEDLPDILKKDPRTKDAIKGGVFKFFRGLGKTLNFNFWYSLYVYRIGNALSLTEEQIENLGREYIATFETAYNYQMNTISQIQREGFIDIGDGSSRCINSAKTSLMDLLKKAVTKREPWGTKSYKLLTENELEEKKLLNKLVSKLQNRESRKAMNSDIQSYAATVLKKSVIRFRKLFESGEVRGRVLFTIHDEIVFSIHKDDVEKFIPRMREIMTSHPDLIKICALDIAISMGYNFLSWSEENPLGQIELKEPPKMFSTLPAESEEQVSTIKNYFLTQLEVG